MARTTSTDVEEAIGPRTDPSGTDIQPYIETAALEVDERLADKGMSGARLEQIEKYLAAHFILFNRKRNRQEKQHSLGNVSKTFTGDFGEALRATSAGQTAIQLDESGTLAKLAEPSASIDVPEVK